MILLKSPNVCNSSIWTSHRFWLYFYEYDCDHIPLSKHVFITNCFIHTYMSQTTLLYESQLFAILHWDQERHTHIHTHMLLFGSYDSCVCCDGVALSKCLINVQIPNAKKSRQAKCNL
jgi:hypothetical protein